MLASRACHRPKLTVIPDSAAKGELDTPSSPCPTNSMVAQTLYALPAQPDAPPLIAGAIRRAAAHCRRHPTHKVAAHCRRNPTHKVAAHCRRNPTRRRSLPAPSDAPPLIAGATRRIKWPLTGPWTRSLAREDRPAS